MPGGKCGHCKQPVVGFGVAADGTLLCHTQMHDCYRLVTRYGHRTDGTCCGGREDSDR